MQKVRVPLTNFAFGEVSPSLYSRTDSAVYNQSAQRVKNFFIRSEGGVIKRSGLQKIYEFDTTVNEAKTQQCRLLPFIFSDDERYIVSLENAKVRIFQINPVNGAVSLIQTITADINSSALKFSDEFLHEYTFAQAGDVMFIAHQTFMPQQIVRTSLTTFQVESFQFDQKSDNKQVYQPYYPFQGAGVTLDPSASSGSGVTLTTSAAYWDTTSPSKHIGTTVRYNGQEIEITGVTNSTTATGDILDSLKIKLSPDSLRTNNGSNIVEVTLVNHGMSVGDSITFSDCDTTGGIAISNLNGARTVAGIISDDVFTFTAGASASGDGVALCDASHPLTNGGTFNNEPSTAADLNETSLEDALISIAGFVDERGLIIALRGVKLIIPRQLQFVAERLMASNLRVGTSDNDTNAIRNMGMLPEGYVVNDYLTDTDAFFIKTDAPNGFKHFERTALSTQMEPDFDTGNMRFKARERYSFGFSDPRCVFGSPGA